MLLTYPTLLILFLLSEFILETTSDLLNLGRLDDRIPEEFIGLYDSDQYSKSIAYQKDGTLFQLFVRSTQFILLAGFIFWGGFNLIDQWARGFHLSSILTGVLFAGILSSLNFRSPFIILFT